MAEVIRVSEARSTIFTSRSRVTETDVVSFFAEACEGKHPKVPSADACKTLASTLTMMRSSRPKAGTGGLGPIRAQIEALNASLVSRIATLERYVEATGSNAAPAALDDMRIVLEANTRILEAFPIPEPRSWHDDAAFIKDLAQDAWETVCKAPTAFDPRGPLVDFVVRALGATGKNVSHAAVVAALRKTSKLA